MTQPITKNTPPPSPAVSLIERASQMARDGYGIEDLMVRLDISRASARAFVLGIGAKK